MSQPHIRVVLANMRKQRGLIVQVTDDVSQLLQALTAARDGVSLVARVRNAKVHGAALMASGWINRNDANNFRRE